MSNVQSSAHYRKLIKERYGREPYSYPQQGKQEYEDLEYVRSCMYEDGKMGFLVNTSQQRLKVKGVPAGKSQTNLNGKKVDEHGRIQD